MTDARSGRAALHGVSLLTALLCGAASIMAFAPLGWWPVMPFALGIFFSLIFRSRSKGRATAIGYAFGLGMFGVGVHWVYYSLHLFGDAKEIVAALGTLIFVVLLSIVPALFGRWAWRQTCAPAAWFLLMAPAAWLLMEWVKTWLFTGFPWLNIGYVTIHTPLAGFAPVGGVLLATLMLAISSGVVGLAFSTRKPAAWLGGVLLLALIWGGGYGLQQVQWTTAQSKTVSVRMVQGNVAQETKFRDAMLHTSLRTYSDLSRSGAELVLWPETAVPTFFYEVDDYLKDFAEALARNGSTVITGGFMVNDAGNEYYNAIKVLGGSQDQVYTKRHLVPFGEFIPFRGLLNMLAELIAIPMSDLSAGRGPIKPITVNGVHYGMSICFEDAFGAEMRVQLPLANVLVNVSNDAWFGDSIAPHQHQEMAAMRSLEFGRQMLRATNNGITAHISERGEILTSAAQFQQATLDVDVVPRDGTTPYVRVGDWLAVALAAVLLIVFALFSITSRGRKLDHSGKNTSL